MFHRVRYLLGSILLLSVALLSIYLQRHAGWEFTLSRDALSLAVPVSEKAYRLDLRPLAPFKFSFDIVDRILLRHALRSRCDFEFMENGVPLTLRSDENAVLHNEGAARKEGRNLFFAPSEGSDPRINGHVYALRVFPVIYTKWLFFLAGASLFLLIPSSIYIYGYTRIFRRAKNSESAWRGRNAERAYATAYVCLFFLMLLLPLFFMNLSEGVRSNQENRMLATRPAISLLFQQPRDFIQQFEAWISDNIGFRDFMLTMHKYIFTKILTSHYLDGPHLVLAGESGHYFHTDNKTLLSVYQGKRWLSDEQMRQLSTGLNELKSFLDAKNISLIVMFCTDKESIYPEYYPKSVVRGPKPTSLDVVNQYVMQNADVDFFCIKERLLAEKHRYLLYPRTGDIYELLHYNSTGGFFAYQELMKHVAAYFPALSPIAESEVTITEIDRGMSIVSMKQEPAFSQVDARFFADALEFENRDKTLPVCLLLRDSYGNDFQQWLPMHFGRTMMHHYSTLERIEEYVEAYKPNIVILEAAERAIPFFAGIVASMPAMSAH